MEMSNAEIARSYRTARYPGRQVKILAELNMCTTDDIIKILIEEGAASPESFGQPRKRGTTQGSKPDELGKEERYAPPEAVVRAVRDWLSDEQNIRRFKTAKDFVDTYSQAKAWLDMQQ